MPLSDTNFCHMKTICVLLFVCCCGMQAFSQVDEIKRASSNNSNSKGSKSSDSSSDFSSDDDGGGGGFFINFLFGGIAEWQSFKLRSDRERYPGMVSLDLMFQGAVKPSGYYILWPRIRGNWGIFSTDFRMNYLIEEDTEGYKHIRTNDWQVLQLNLVTSRFVTLRFGTGFMQEAFNTKEMFSESAILLGIHAPDQTKSINFEYRFALDFDSDANPRDEFGVYYQHQLFSSGKLHGYVSVGGVYQNYYHSIEVWGFQGGFVLRIF